MLRKTLVLAMTLFGLGAAPMFHWMGQAGVAAWAWGVGVSLLCALGANGMRELTRNADPITRGRAMAVGPVMRVGAAFMGLLLLRVVTAIDLDALVLSVGLSYQVFLFQSVKMELDLMQQGTGDAAEARLA